MSSSGRFEEIMIYNVELSPEELKVFRDEVDEKITLMDEAVI